MATIKSIEEKAKAYDEVREKIAIRFGSNVADEIFSQFEMSEDERIRKEIIDYLSTVNDKELIPYESWIAWLEKQGEQKPDEEYNITGIGSKHAEGKLGEMIKNLKPVNEIFEQKLADKVEPKFEIGDLITNGILVGKIDEIHELGYHAYFGDHYADVPDAENWHKWTIQDAKDGDVLRIRNLTFIFQEITNNNVCHKDAVVAYCSYEDNDDGFGVCGPDCITDLEIITPATKEQRELLFQKMNEAGYEWGAEKKELKKIKQQPNWSEEDDLALMSLLRRRIIG